MFSEDGMSGIMRMIRAAGLFVVFLIALAGVPQSATAFYCEDYLITCSTLSSCLEHINDDCGPASCDGKFNCRAEGWEECEEDEDFPIATTCEFDIS